MSLQKQTLKNGLRLITAQTPWTKAVTLLVIAKVGSRYEHHETNGISHFIEHLMFKGTKKRPTTLHISRELDRVGAEYNAFTAKDHTGYYIKVAKEHLPLAADILFDMLQNSLFKEEEVERERKVILEEIKMYYENPLMHIGDLFEQSLYANHSLGWDIAGDAKTMANIGRKDIISFFKSYYGPANVTVTVAGDLDKKDHTLIEKYAKQFHGKKELAPVFDKFTWHAGVGAILDTRPVEQVQVELGFPAYEYAHKMIPALHVLNVILGGNMSSRLFISVRERRGLAYSVRSDASSYEDTGSFAVHAGLDSKRLDEALKVIVQELKKIRKGVTKKELADAKEFIKGKITLSFEDTLEIAGWYGRQEVLTGKTMTPEEKLKEIKAVTLAQIQNVARDIIKPENMRCALIGPVDNKEHVLKQVRFTI